MSKIIKDLNSSKINTQIRIQSAYYMYYKMTKYEPKIYF